MSVSRTTSQSAPAPLRPREFHSQAENGGLPSWFAPVLAGAALTAALGAVLGGRESERGGEAATPETRSDPFRIFRGLGDAFREIFGGERGGGAEAPRQEPVNRFATEGPVDTGYAPGQPRDALDEALNNLPDRPPSLLRPRNYESQLDAVLDNLPDRPSPSVIHSQGLSLFVNADGSGEQPNLTDRHPLVIREQVYQLFPQRLRGNPDTLRCLDVVTEEIISLIDSSGEPDMQIQRDYYQGLYRSEGAVIRGAAPFQLVAAVLSQHFDDASPNGWRERGNWPRPSSALVREMEGLREGVLTRVASAVQNMREAAGE